MGEYVSIQEGNQNKAFNGLNKLETDLQGGGSCFWAPKSTRQLESISIKANGTYHPEEKYGISRASVSVPGTSDKISGKGQDGNDYTISLDEATGDLIKTKVPSSIAVTQPPTTLEYEDGDRISFVNIEVTAYDGEGNEFDIAGYPDGAIPFEELQFPVIKAVYDESDPSGQPIIPFEDIEQFFPCTFGGLYQKIHTTEAYMVYWYSAFRITNGVTITYGEESGDHISFMFIAASREPFLYESIHLDAEREITPTLPATTFTYDNKTVYWAAVNMGGRLPVVSNVYPINIVSDIGDPNYVAKRIAWCAIYGNVNQHIQPIPVNWPRYNDGKILTASFDITVSPKASTNTNNEDDGFTGHDGSIDDDSGGGGGHSF